VAILGIIAFPDKRLARKALPVEEFDSSLQSIVSDLEETMEHGPGAVGIAAPQVGIARRIAIVDVTSLLDGGRKRKPKSSNNGRMVLVNPEILGREGEVTGREGCLSVPDYTGNVVRADRIRLLAQDVSGVLREYRCNGFESRAVQHEIDHLDGVLFLDRVISPRELFRRRVYK
jgi:peptide deformylase